MDALTSLVKQIESEDLACRAAYMLDLSGSGDRSSDSTTTTETDVKLGLKPLIERLDRYLDVAIVEKSLASATNPFVQLPPPFEPVPVKPILFDLALNYVNFPSLADKVDSSGLAKDAGSGLAGLVRGWLWGKSNAQSDSKS
ncbi:unnamed protein product [Dicrocoelium dendriticum]|nr:unnamed protein product [Dicrocoelium dendriticum]